MSMDRSERTGETEKSNASSKAQEVDQKMTTTRVVLSVHHIKIHIYGRRSFSRITLIWRAILLVAMNFDVNRLEELM